MQMFQKKSFLHKSMVTASSPHQQKKNSEWPKKNQTSNLLHLVTIGKDPQFDQIQTKVKRYLNYRPQYQFG